MAVPAAPVPMALKDDTMQKTVDTRRPCEVGLRACNSLLQQRCREGVAEDYCMLAILLAVPSCINSFGTVSSLHSYKCFTQAVSMASTQ